MRYKVKARKIMKIADLKTNLFVRQSLNQDHVLYLAQLVENGVKLPPIRVTVQGRVIDGRHRIEAYELNDITEIEVEIVDIFDEIDLIAEAYKANAGGSLPPTTQDTEHTIMLLLERGESMKQIGEVLGLPTGMARKYVSSVRSKISRQKLMKAVAAVTEGGLTVAKAAEQFEVEKESLKNVLSGHKRKNKAGLAEVQRGITKSHSSLSQKNAALMQKIFDAFDDGDVSENQVREVFKHIGKLQRSASRAISGWKSRFDAKVKKP
jgi:transposase-like protein